MATISTNSAQATADPRIQRSEAAIQQALLDRLAAGRPFDALTVSEVAEHAGVTRKTFYARFGSLEQVVQRRLEALLQDIAMHIDDDMLVFSQSNPSLALLVFHAYEAHWAALAPFIRHCPAGLFTEPVTAAAATLLDRLVDINEVPPLPEGDKVYLVALVASAVHGVLSAWALRDFAESAEQVALLVDAVLVPGVRGVLTRADRQTATT